jgi:hypothetical protein
MTSAWFGRRQPAAGAISRIPAAGWDPGPVPFDGASDAGQPPAQVCDAAAGALRQAIEMTALAERGRDTGPDGYDTIARDMAHGWPHLFEIRCAYPAATSETPIPCDTVHRDPAAPSFRDLGLSALAAGWDLDALGRWACPRCGQASSEYRTRRPVTVWADGAAGRRGEMWDVHEAYGGPPVLTPGGQILTIAAEHVLTARAEHDLFRRVRDARAKHAGMPR